MITIDREFTKRDKKVAKMTKDGLVERNLATGEEVRVSQRGQDFRLSSEQAEKQSFTPGRDNSSGRTRRKQKASPNRTGWFEIPAQDTPEEPLAQSAPEAHFSGVHESLLDPPLPENDRVARMDEPGRMPFDMDDRQSAQDDAPPADSPGRLRFDRTAKAKNRQRGTQYQREFTKDGESTASAGFQPDTGAAPDASTPKPPSGSKLQFDPSETAPTTDPPNKKKLDKATRQAEKADAKLNAAREKLPTKRRAKMEKGFDPETGKVGRRLHFEKTVKSQGEHFAGPLPLRPVKAAGNMASGFVHKKIYQVQEDNVGVKAAHKAELLAEGGVRYALRRRKTAPYRKVAKLERKATKKSMKLSFERAAAQNPQLQKSALSRFIQRQKIKRQYANAARDARRAHSFIWRGGRFAVKGAIVVAKAIIFNPKVLVTIGLFFLIITMFVSMFSACANIFTGGLSAVLSSSHLAEDEDINSASIIYTRWENELRQEIENIEDDWPGFDEYRYFLDDIGHCPRQLISFLTAVYRDFAFADVYATLRELFEAQYQLELVEEVEIRTRIVIGTDPDTGESYEFEEEYEWWILNVILTTTPFYEVISPRMDDDQREIFDLIIESGGNRQYVMSPFDFDWTPFISSHFGYRRNPFTGATEFHTGIDIALPTGTPIIAAHDGIITFVAHDTGGYGSNLIITGADGVSTRYAHCSVIFVSVGQEVSAGDVIALVGSTGASTGPHLHFEVIRHGVFLNPIYFALLRS